MRGMSVCYMHGGVSTNFGAGSPTYKHGRYSKVLPERLAARYDAARANPDLLSLRDDLATCESRLAELFARLDSGESGATWRALGQALADFETARALGNALASQLALAQMHTLIRQGASDDAAWEDIRAMWDMRCKLTFTETKTLHLLQQMITAEQLSVYMGVITDAIHRCVTAHAANGQARAILGDIAAEFRRLTVLQTGGGAES